MHEVWPDWGWGQSERSDVNMVIVHIKNVKMTKTKPLSTFISTRIEMFTNYNTIRF